MCGGEPPHDSGDMFTSNEGPLMPPLLSRRGGWTALCTAVAVLAASPAPASPADAGPASSPPAVPAAARAAVPPDGTRVTLVTGDTVTVTTAADGTPTHLVQDPQGRYTGFETHRSGPHTYVYPRGALPYVAAGVLDEELFDITRLVADGYDDAHRDRLPLIVTYTDTARDAGRRTAPDGARAVRALDSIGGAALTVERSAAFWTSVTGGAPARDAGPGPRLRDGIAKVWLDGKVKAALADSTAQVGAPEVWSSGNTGENVDVAVLDTGVDTAHPDLAGRIAATAGFVPGESVTDANGHGTHVASTVAGTGAASGGRERGVAPGARLHVGKVLSDDGTGQDSWVLAGMEWAAREQQAKIVSMSLGGPSTDGSDALSLAVDRLSRETGALFTVAAGNSGPDGYTVGAPGVAAQALTVGAVDGTDTLADFSARGPRPGDRGAKPDLTAPGVGVLAARSQYAAEGSGPYQTLSGTSMATPHVAGAAALLAAEHPDWSGRRLKDALVSTTKATPAYTAFEAGTGRLDAAAAVSATVFATGGADFGFRAWPVPAGARAERTVTYTNTGDSPAALRLSVQGSFTLSADTLTVPAHGTADVTVTAHYDRVPADRATAGFLTATDASGTALTRTSLSAAKEGERHRLTLRAKDRGGRPAGGTVVLTAEKLWLPLVLDASGTLDLRLPPGSYTAWLDTPLEGAHGPHSVGQGLLALTDIDLRQDRTAVFDGTRARRVTAVTPDPSTPDDSRVNLFRGFAADDWSSSSRWTDASYDSVWALPTGRKVTEGRFEFGTRWRLRQPVLTVASDGEAFDDLRVAPGATAPPEGRGRLDAVFAGNGAPEAYASRDVRGRAVVVRRDDAVTVPRQAAAAARAGARLLLVVHDGAGRLQPWEDSPWQPADPPPLTVATLTRDGGERLIGRLGGRDRVRLDITSHPVADYVYDLAHDYRGAVPTDLVHRVDRRELARVDVSFRNHRPGRALDNRDDVTPAGGSALNPSEAPARGERTDWVTAGEPWADRAQIPGEQQQSAPPAVHRAGTAARVSWFGPVQRPRLLDGEAPARQDDRFYVTVPGWGDSGTAHAGGTYGNFDADNRVSVYQGDTLLGRTSRYQLSMTLSGLRPGPLPYRLVSENSRGTWSAPYSTTTRTEWAFTSRAGAPGEQAQLPLIQLDYGVGTDASGRAGRHAAVTVAAAHLAGSAGAAPVDAVTLEVSYDDGATWRRAPLRRTASGWQTRLDAPRGARFATLRADARDARGNSVRQSIVRAFGLR